MDTEDLLARLVRAGFGDVAAARHALEAVLDALVASGGGPELQLLAQVLPTEFMGRLAGAPDRPFDIDAFYASAADHEGLGPGPGLEHAQMICRELGQLVDVEARQRLGHATTRELFEAPRYTPAVEPAHPARPTPHTLAAGRPGSSRPLAEAAPPGAQSGSVAEANPHEDTKLSSARGLTQEALHEDLATGKSRK